MSNLIRIIFGGDVMLGRLVKDAIITQGIDYPMGHIALLMQECDAAIVNLECAITKNPHEWHGMQKAFYFGAPPEAAKILTKCGVRLVSLANNHVLDYDYQGLRDTEKYLQQENIIYVGAGENENKAYSPRYLHVKDLHLGMIAFCDHQADFAANTNTPGMAYLDLYNEENALEQFELHLIEMQKAKVDWPILSLHWGPNMVWAPSERFQRLARNAIEMGYKMIFGHSAHVYHGVEMYRDCPIIYAAGDLVDDYYVDPEFQNDHQLLFELQLSQKKFHQMVLYPVFIEACQTKLANRQQFSLIEDRMKTLCKEMGTTVHRHDERSLLIK